MSRVDAKILLVEDEPALRFMVERQLKVLGYVAADIVASGLLAVQKATENQYHVIFMDVRLPDIDGVTATKLIREVEQKANTHAAIIGMTAYAQKERCIGAGMDDFLQKPVLLQQLKEMLDKWYKDV